jgi:hypothetical protein
MELLLGVALPHTQHLRHETSEYWDRIIIQAHGLHKYGKHGIVGKYMIIKSMTVQMS